MIFAPGSKLLERMTFWFGAETPVALLGGLLDMQVVALVNDAEVASAVLRELPGNLLKGEPLVFPIDCPIKGGDKLIGELRGGERLGVLRDGLVIHASVTVSGEVDVLEPGEGGCS
jgi:hypothetical protein